MSRFIVHQLHAGAPDKIQLWTDGSYDLIKHDHTDLVDVPEDILSEWLDNDEYILPADEGDIKVADLYNQKCKGLIMLPQYENGNVIEFDRFVPKNSEIYNSLITDTKIKYPKTVEFEVDDNLLGKLKSLDLNGKALKSSAGSGSRGVLLIDKNRIHLGGKYVDKVTEVELQKLIDYCKKMNANLLIQDLIPFRSDLTKVNVDFVIRDGNLLGYKWDMTDPSAVFTNWDWGYTVRNSYTDEVMNQVAFMLAESGVYNAIMNFEAFSNLTDETWLVEFNWRYSNSMFEAQAAGVDLISCYLNRTKFEMPKGRNKFSRFWQCRYYNDLKDYNDGF